ncbi:MAG: hypothetical protein WC934_06325 [Acidithiobacillus sp.]|jgi:hypothetical protein|uniref:hypothetical protein n=1 Tax=Acidithiobacillus sp. TaxID=1872118 RepID=UPI003560FE30
MKKNFIGDAHLKQFSQGILATNKPITQQQSQIFAIFIRGINVKRIALSLHQQPQDIFNIIRIVGFKYQQQYKNTLKTPLTSHKKLIFQDFVKGHSIPTLLSKYNIEPNELFTILREIGKIYERYK